MRSYADVQMHFTNRMSGIIAQKRAQHDGME